MAVEKLSFSDKKEALRYIEYYKKYTIRVRFGIWNAYTDINYKKVKELTNKSSYVVDMMLDNVNKFLLITYPFEND